MIQLIHSMAAPARGRRDRSLQSLGTYTHTSLAASAGGQRGASLQPLGAELILKHSLAASRAQTAMGTL